MKFKKAESCSCGSDSPSTSEGGSYCDGNYGEPKGHLDTQIFPCKQDPSTPRKRKKKSKKAGAFNLMDYRTASQNIQRNPELMNKLDPSDLDLFTELKAKHPELSLQEILDIIKKKKLLPKDKPEFPSQRNILPGSI